MNHSVTITIENLNHKYDHLISEVEPFCRNTRRLKSCAGIEITTLILTAGQLIVALLSIPLLYDAINSDQVTLKFGGIQIKDSVDNIVDTLESDPNFINELKLAMQQQTLSIDGKASAVKNLYGKVITILEGA